MIFSSTFPFSLGGGSGSGGVVFPGAAFYVQGASQYSPKVARVKFNSTPKASSALAGDDALNPTNYVFSGPAGYTLDHVAAVSGDPLSFDVYHTSNIAVGLWTVTVNNVLNPSNDALTAPIAASFSVLSAYPQTPLSGGAENDDPESIIRKHLSQALKGPNWDALIKALAVGDEHNWDNARAAFDQLFLSSASGIYLERKARNIGITKPVNVGMSDDNFRRLAIKTNANKVVHEAVRETLEVYYGQDSLRAYVETDLEESFNLDGGLTLQWLLDEKDSFEVEFLSTNFMSMNAATALEIAFVLTKTMRDAGSKGFASVFTDPATGGKKVRIYSGSLGLGSFVRITGGTAQNIFRFPSVVGTYTGVVTVADAYTWNYGTRPDQNTTRVELTIVGPGLIDLSSVREGDYVIIGEDAQTGFTGSYAIKNVQVLWSGANLYQSFDIDQVDFQSTGIQLSNDAYKFFRPIRNSISAAGGRTVVVAQSRPGEVDINLPTTTQIVSRGPALAMYGRLNSGVAIQKLSSNAAGLTTINTAAAHGLSAGSWVQIDDFKPAQGRPYITIGFPGNFPDPHTFPASQTSILAECGTSSAAICEDAASVVMDNGQILFCGGFTRVAGSYNNDFGFQAYTGASTTRAFCNRYVPGTSLVVAEGTEADGATQLVQTWASTSALNFAREHHAASPYLTGAMATGGQLFNSPHNSAEIYVPGGSWTLTSNMIEYRSGHQQVELDSGNILVVGGANGRGTATPTAEIYDGTSWAYTGSMHLPRADFQAVKLSDGRVLAIGGRAMGKGHNIDANTLALWPFDETVGNFVDTANSYSLTPTGGVVYDTDSKIGTGDLGLPGGESATATGNALAYNGLKGEWTVECWVKITDFTNPTTIINYGEATGAEADNTLLHVGVGADKKVFWRWEHGAGTTVTGTASLPLDSVGQYRSNFYNHFAIKKSFSPASTLNVVSASRATNVSTLTFDSNHAYAPGDKVYFVSQDPAKFSSGYKTITAAPAANQISYAEAAADVVYWVLKGQVCNVFDVTLYINSMETDSWLANVNSSGGTTSTWNVGKDPKDGTASYIGSLDDLRISTIARSPAEIRENFLNGWGNLQPINATDMAVGKVTNTCEIFNGTTWAMTGQMSTARAYHRAVVLPGDFVLVMGGLGCSPNVLPDITRPYAMGLWPSESLNTAELWNPNTGQWTKLSPAGAARHSHVMVYLPTQNQIVVIGGKSLNVDATYEPFPKPEIYDVSEGRWRTAPMGVHGWQVGQHGWQIGETITGAALPDDSAIVTYGGTFVDNATCTKALVFIPGSNQVSSGGINAQHRVVSTPTSTSFTIQKDVGYTSNFGPSVSYVDYITMTNSPVEVSGEFKISTGVRTSNVTTLTLSIPFYGQDVNFLITNHGIAVGDIVFVNSHTGAFGSGIYTVTSATDTTITYTEAGADQVSIAVSGAVSINSAPDIAMVSVAAASQPVNDPGPFLFDPDNGLAVTGTESTIVTSPKYINQNYSDVTIDNTTGQGLEFPDSTGYITFGFGTDTQSAPVKYLGRYADSGSTVKLVLDYSYKFTTTQPVGTTVTFLSQRAPFAPNSEGLGAAYLTDSSSGRVAAQTAVETILGAGVTPNVTVVYPGSHGLGGEGSPTHGAQKLSDVVGIFAGDDISAEIQSKRES